MTALGILVMVAALAATYLARTRLVLTTRNRYSEDCGDAFLRGISVGMKMADVARDLSDTYGAIDEAQAAEKLSEALHSPELDTDDDPLVEIEVVLGGELCFQTIPSSTSGRDVFLGAFQALEVTPDGVEWNYHDAEGVAIGLGADAGTLALMPQPLYIGRSVG